MMIRPIAPLCAFLLLGGCMAAVAPVDVTRFHGASVPRSGETVTITPAQGRDGTGIEYRTYANALRAALARAGFAVTDSGGTALVATLDYEIAIDRPVDTRGKPVSVGVGGSTGSYGGGLGVGIGIDLSGPPKAQIASRMAVRLKSATTGEAVWEGRAETRAKEGTPSAQPGIAAGKLADALFRDFPGPSGATITVK